MNTYLTDDCAVFFKTREQYGELSNMRHDYPLNWNNRIVYSSEALYQAHKFFPDTVIVEEGKSVCPFEVVITQKNAMTSKMKAKRYSALVRPDWHDIKFDVMNYCVRLKYFQHQAVMDAVLDDTEDRLIVEKSRKDQFWGAVNDYKGNLVGENVLGCLWMILREERPNVTMPAGTVTPRPISALP